MVLLAAIVGCSDLDDDGFVAAVDGASSAPRHPDAVYSAEEAAYQMKEAVRFGLPSVVDLWGVWSEFLSHGDSECPGGGSEQTALEVFDPMGCTAASGYWYQGVGGGGIGWTDSDGDSRPDMYLEMLKADGTMRSDDGATFRFGGDMSLFATGDMDYAVVSAALLGSYEYLEASAGWLTQGSSSALYMEGTREAGVWKLTLNGGITVTDQAVGFRDYGFNGVCGAFPSGSAAVRDDVGYWYELEYDETTCDGCGEVVFDHNQSLGRACADLSSAVQFSLIPTDMAMSEGGQWQ